MSIDRSTGCTPPPGDRNRLFRRPGYASVARGTGRGLLVALLLLLMSCTFGRMIRYGASGVDDYRIFPWRALKASAAAQPFALDTGPGTFPERFAFEGAGVDFDAFFAANDSLAFLALHHGALIAERYYNGHSASAISLSFSMAKSFTSVLVGCAIDDGYIRSENQPVTDFLHEFASRGFRKVTIRHLLQMTAGSDYVEADVPFCVHPYMYYTGDMMQFLDTMRIVQIPGTQWRYKSGENQLLGLILQQALPRGMSITDYMQRRIWEPLGMEHDARWSVDHLPDGLEKTFCCLAATARDFARIGQLYLWEGAWKGRQIVSRRWVETSTMLDERDASPWSYQYQWWKLSPDGHDFAAIGHLGQYIYVDRAHDLVLVRLGTSLGHLDSKQWRKLWPSLAEQIALYRDNRSGGVKTGTGQ